MEQSREHLCVGSKKLVGHSIPALLERIESSNNSPCFMLAPRLCGQQELLKTFVARSETPYVVSHFEISSDGACLEEKPERVSGVMPDRFSGTSTNRGANTHCLALIPFVPWLDDKATKRFSGELDILIKAGYRVVVCCPVQNDRYGELQSNRGEISAQELKEAGFLSPQAYSESLRQFLIEFLPLEIRLAAVLAAILGQSNLDEISRLGYRLSPDVPSLLEQMHPLFAATESGRGIRSEPVDLLSISQEIRHIIDEYLKGEGERVGATVLASRITMLSIILLEKGNLEASHQVLEIAENFVSLTLEDLPVRVSSGTHQLKVGETRYFTLPDSSLMKAVIPELRLRLFGKMEVSIQGEVLRNNQLSRSKIRRLLAYLALNQHRVVSRDLLVDYLWPSMDSERAQKNLYSSWCMLAKALGSESVKECPYILRKGEIYQLNQELVLCDTDQFEQLARSLLFEQFNENEQTQQLFELEALYRDSLVACIPADSFLKTKMYGYRSMMVDILLMVARQMRAAGMYEKALFCTRSAYELDESREDVYRDLMGAQFEAGQRTSAMQTYFSCKRYLADELGILPSKRTTALYQDLLLDNCR